MPVTIADPRAADSPVVMANEASCDLTPYDREDVIGRNCRFLQTPDTGNASLRMPRGGVERRGHVEVELKNIRGDGAVFSSFVIVTPLRSTTGTDIPLGFQIGMPGGGCGLPLVSDAGPCPDRRMVRQLRPAHRRRTHAASTLLATACARRRAHESVRIH